MLEAVLSKENVDGLDLRCSYVAKMMVLAGGSETSLLGVLQSEM